MDVTGANGLRLEWHKLAKTYGSRPIWQGLDGVVEQGEVLVIGGPNGSGKSTLTRLLCGLEQPTVGHIRYLLRDRALTPREARPLIGLVAPDTAVYRDLTALENLQFFATVRGLRPAETDLIAALDAVGLAGRHTDRVATYSSGMALRLKYAIAMLSDPAILVLDEPTAMFDDAGRALVESIIATQRRRGITIVATNDARERAWGDLVLNL